MNIGYFKYDVPENSRYSPFYAISFEFTIWKVREFNDIKQWKGKRDKKFHNDLKTARIPRNSSKHGKYYVFPRHDFSNCISKLSSSLFKIIFLFLHTL